MKTDNSNIRASRRLGMEYFDSILSGGILKQLGLYGLTILVVYLLCVVVSFGLASLGGGTLNICQPAETSCSFNVWRGVLYHFLDPGNLNQEEGWGAVVAPFISLFGMILLGGILVTTLSNIVDRRVEQIANGLITYNRGIHDHYVIIGYGEIAVSLLLNIFDKDRTQADNTGNTKYRYPKVLILTSQNVPKVRTQVQSQLSEEMERNVLFYSGDIESREHIKRLNIDKAKEVYILGEVEEYGRDSKNLECVRLLRELRGSGKKTMPVYVQFDRLSSYSIIKKLNIPSDYVSDGERQVLYFRPFNFFENWARLLWGDYRSEEYKYDVLDFDPNPESKGDSHILGENSDRHVHLVIVGFNRMGRALLLEALRICHYPNYNEESGANKTRITVIDAKMDKLLPQFESQYPYIKEIADVDIEYRTALVEDVEIRKMLEYSAAAERELLTVAICLLDPDSSLATGLSLPESLYYTIHEERNEAVNNSKVRILVRQELQKGIGNVLKENNDKYKYVKIFGMLEGGISHRLLDDTKAMWANANYNEEGILKKALAEKDASLKKQKKKVEGEKSAMEKATQWWYEISEDFRFSNRHQIDMYDIYRRYKEECKPETLCRMEHLRWCADRRIIGYQSVASKKMKNVNFKTHHLLVRYCDLGKEQEKDKNVVENLENIEKLGEKNCFKP